MVELKYGWVGKILKVDLTDGKITETPTSDYVPKFIGGRSIGAKIYWDEVPQECKALDPENALIFVTGPATGTPAPAAAKFCVTSKSPAILPVNSYYWSVPGGYWGIELKFAGYDGLIVKGKASHPIYIYICDGVTEIRNADHLWGMVTSSTQKELKRIHDEETMVVNIGPAGEKLTVESSIIVDTGHATGNGGFGAVMGSKNLKAIAVKGTGAIAVARPKELLEVRQYFSNLATRKPNEPEAQNPIRSMQYYTLTHWGYQIQVPFVDDSKVGEMAQKGLLKMRYTGCYGCIANCRLHIKWTDNMGRPNFTGQCNEGFQNSVEEQRYYGGKFTGPVTFEASALCEEYGMSTGQSKGFWNGPWLWYLFQKGVITEKECGLPGQNGDKIGSREFHVALERKIAYREGPIFEKLGEGEDKFFQWLIETRPQFKDIVQDIYDWRVPRHGIGYLHYLFPNIFYATSMATVLCYLTDCRSTPNDPLGHSGGLGKVMPATSEERRSILAAGYQKYYDTKLGPNDPEKFPSIAIYNQNKRIEADSIPYCNWILPKYYSMYTPDHLGDPTTGIKVLAAVTGIERTEKENLRLIGDTTFTLERAIAVREGRRRRHDTFNDGIFDKGFAPQPFGEYTDPKPMPRRKQAWFSKEWVSKALDSYYSLRGWDTATGIPKRVTLEKLGLKDVAEDMEKKYKIPVPP